MREYPNLPPTIGAVVSSRLATLHELQTVYGIEALYDFLEVLAIDGYNRRVVTKAVQKR